MGPAVLLFELFKYTRVYVHIERHPVQSGTEANSYESENTPTLTHTGSIPPALNSAGPAP